MGLYAPQKGPKIAYIPLSNAVARPRTVMVDAQYTSVTRNAMIGIWRSKHVTFHTLAHFLCVFALFRIAYALQRKLLSRLLTNDAGIGKRGRTQRAKRA